MAIIEAAAAEVVVRRKSSLYELLRTLQAGRDTEIGSSSVSAFVDHVAIDIPVATGDGPVMPIASVLALLAGGRIVAVSSPWARGEMSDLWWRMVRRWARNGTAPNTFPRLCLVSKVLRIPTRCDAGHHDGGRLATTRLHETFSTDRILLSDKTNVG